MAIWYQLAQVLSPAPLLLGGWSVGPPEVVGVAPPLVKAGLLPWQGAEGLPPWLGAVDLPPWLDVDELPPWLDVDELPPWLEAGPCPPPWGVGCTLPGHPTEASVAGVLVRAGLGGRFRPLGQVLGGFGIGLSWRQGTKWIRPCWATLQW